MALRSQPPSFPASFWHSEWLRTFLGDEFSALRVRYSRGADRALCMPTVEFFGEAGTGLVMRGVILSAEVTRLCVQDERLHDISPCRAALSSGLAERISEDQVRLDA
jgi:hypothetical protein